jgi:hypothetical protein
MFYVWQITPACFESTNLMTQEKGILVYAGKDCEYLLRRGISFFLDSIFKSSSRQFDQLYSLSVDLETTSHENYTHPVLFAFFPDKKEKKKYFFFIFPTPCVIINISNNIPTLTAPLQFY